MSSSGTRPSIGSRATRLVLYRNIGDVLPFKDNRQNANETVNTPRRAVRPAHACQVAAEKTSVRHRAHVCVVTHPTHPPPPSSVLTLNISIVRMVHSIPVTLYHASK